MKQMKLWIVEWNHTHTSMNFSIVESVGLSIIKNRMFLNSISAGSGRLAFMAVIYKWDYTPNENISKCCFNAADSGNTLLHKRSLGVKVTSKPDAVYRCMRFREVPSCTWILFFLRWKTNGWNPSTHKSLYNYPISVRQNKNNP